VENGGEEQSRGGDMLWEKKTPLNQGQTRLQILSRRKKKGGVGDVPRGGRKGKSKVKGQCGFVKRFKAKKQQVGCGVAKTGKGERRG